jgi:hypothetical protein
MNEAEVERAQRELHRGLDDPDAFFAERGIILSCCRADREWWAYLGRRSQHPYGEGPSERRAKESAVRRWMVEQEHPDLRRHPGEPLP